MRSIPSGGSSARRSRASGRAHPARRRRSSIFRRRLFAEVLEDRRLLAVFAWDGGGDGSSWDDPLNWNGNTLPGAEDDVLISVAGATPVISAEGGEIRIRNLRSTEVLRIGSDLFTASGTVEILAESLTVTRGMFNAERLEVHNATFSFGGGDIAAPVRLTNSQLLIGSSGALDATLHGEVTLLGTLAAGQTLRLQGIDEYHATLTAEEGAVIAGTVELATGRTDRMVTVQTVEEASLLVAQTGRIVALAGEAGLRSVVGHLVNQGRLVAEADTQLDIRGRYVSAGGGVDGQVLFENVILEVTAEPAEETILTLLGDTTLVSDNLPKTVLYLPGTYPWHARLVVPNDVTNHGVIRLGSWRSDRTSEVVIHGVLRNAAGGILAAISDQGGDRLITGSFLNEGRIDVEDGSQLVIQNHDATFVQAGGRIQAEGALVVVSGQWEFVGGDLQGNVSGVAVTLRVGEQVAGPSRIDLLGGSRLLENLSPVVTLRLTTSYSYHSELAIAPGAVNHGTIELNSTRDDRFAAIETEPNAVLVISSLGRVVAAGTGLGGRHLRGSIENQGQILAEPGNPLAFVGHYDSAGGRVDGDVSFFNSTFTITAEPVAPTTLMMFGANTLLSDNRANTILHLETSWEYHASLSVPASAANHGVIRLDSARPDRYSELLLHGSFVNESAGRIESLRGEGGERRVVGSLVNYGEIFVEADSRLVVENSNHSFTQAGGSIEADGTFTVHGGAFQFTGGELRGTVETIGTALSVGAGVVDDAELLVTGESRLVQNLSPATTLRLITSYEYHSNLVVDAAAENRGTILLDSTRSDRYANVAIEEGAVLTNASSGRIRSLVGGGGGRSITGSVRNEGTISAERDSGLSFTGRYHGAGGHVTADVSFVDTTFELTAVPTQESTLVIYGANTLIGDNPRNTTLHLQTSYWYNASLSSAGLSNHGRIILDTSRSDRSSQLLLDGGTLHNAPTGVLEVRGGTQALAATLENYGKVYVRSPATIGAPDSRHVNHGVIQVADVLVMDGESFVNEIGAIIAGNGDLRVSTTDFIDHGTVDFSPPSLIDVTFDAELVELQFVGAMVPTSVEINGTYSLVSSGGDGGFTEGNEVDWDPFIQEVVHDEAAGVARILLSESLPDDVIRLEIYGDGPRDSAGIALLPGQIQTVIGRLTEVPTRVEIRLAEASDSGTSNTDGITREPSPEWEVTVNKAGRVELLLDSSTNPIISLAVDRPGIYRVVTPSLSDGEHRLEARFETTGGRTAQASATFTIDSGTPAVIPGVATEQAPLLGRWIRFDEPIDIAALTTDSVLLRHADGSQVPLHSVIGSGIEFFVQFDPLIVAGEYTISVPANLTDLAGNPLGDPGGTVGTVVVETFELLPDVTRPTITRFSPVGIRREGVSQFQLEFSEAIDVASWGTDDLQLLGIDGAIDLTSATVVSVTDRVFTIEVPEIVAEDQYRLLVGPAIRDIAGNNMVSAQHALLEIDRTGPRVTSTSLADSWTQPLDRIKVQFNEAVDPATLDSAVQLFGPAGITPLWWAEPLGNDRFQLHFSPSPRRNGDYILLIGEQLTDVVGNPLHQPAGDAGDGAGDAFEQRFTLALPDLRVTALQGPPQARFGESVEFPYEVRNVGGSDAVGDWSDAFFLSDDEHWSADDRWVASVPVQRSAPLEAGARYHGSVTVNLPFEPGWTAGEYHLIVVANIDGNLVEATNESNEASAPLSLSYGALPDLQATAVAASTDTMGPGESISLHYKVGNPGNAAVASSWLERIYVTSDLAGETRTLLGEFRSQETILAPGEMLARTRQVRMPVFGSAGEVRFAVEVDAWQEIVESDEANWFVAADPTQWESRLTVVPAARALHESGGALEVTIYRTGSVEDALQVQLSSSRSDRLRMPAAATIPAGQYAIGFTIEAAPNLVADGDVALDIFAQAAGFPGAAADLLIRDDDEALLELVLPDQRLQENERFATTIRRFGPLDESLSVRLVAEPAGKVNWPAEVQFAAGEAEVVFESLVLDDRLMESERDVHVQLAANRYARVTGTIRLAPSDVPLLSLVVPASGLIEGDLSQKLVVRRSPVTSEALRVRLESASPTQIAIQREVVIPAGKAAAYVPLLALDNDQVEETRTVQLHAQLIDSRSAAAVEGGTASVGIELRDNDQPSIYVNWATSLIAEGGRGELTVRRNDVTDESLPVQLSLNHPQHLNVPDSVVIPAGEDRVVIEVRALTDDATDGDQTVTVTATASGFTTAKASVVVTDRDLPELIGRIVTIPNSSVTEQQVNVAWEVRNEGFAAALGTWSQRLFLRSATGNLPDVLIGQYTVNGPLAPGQRVARTVPVTLPRSVGEFQWVLVTDAAGTVTELLEENNVEVSTGATLIREAYTATLQADAERAPAGTPITLSGRALQSWDGRPASFVQVHVHVSVKGTTRMLPAFTDADGRFAVVFTPLTTEAGQYVAGATHPAATVIPAQATFSLLGMQMPPWWSTLEVRELETVSTSLSVRNPADLPLTGMRVEIVSAPENLEVSTDFGGLTELPADGELPLRVQIRALDASDRYGEIRLRVLSDDAPAVDSTLPVRVQPLTSRLVVEQKRLASTMLVGESVTIPVSVSNLGGKLAESLQVILPPDTPWLSVGTRLPEILEVDQTTTFDLRLTPSPNLPLTEYHGSLLVRAADSWESIPFVFRAVSDAKAELKIRVVDEYFYFGEDQPPLEGARVALLDAFSGLPLEDFPAQLTSQSGEVQFAALPAGYYTLEVTADKHQSFRQQIYVQPGERNEQQVFISRHAVEYTWTVTEIEIEDRTEITIESSFETAVPIPVVTVDAVFDLAELQVIGQTMQVNVKITNHGLIAALDVALDFGEHPYYRFRPLVDVIGTLPAQTEIVVPVIVERVADGETLHGAEGEHFTVPCDLFIQLLYTYICDEKIGVAVPIAVLNVDGNCPVVPVAGGGGWGGGGGDPAAGGPSGPGTVVPVLFPPIELCDCVTLKYSVEFSQGGFLNSLVDAVTGFVDAVPFISDVDVELSGLVELEKCCDGKKENGWKLKGEAALELVVGVALGPNLDGELAEDVPVPGGGFQIDVDASIGAGLIGEFKMGGGVAGESQCNFANLEGCAFLRGSGDFLIGVKGEVEIDIEFPGQEEIEVIGIAEGGIKTGIEGSVQACIDFTGAITTKGKMCWKGLEVVLTVAFEYQGRAYQVGISRELAEEICFPAKAAGESEGTSPPPVELISGPLLAEVLGYPTVEDLNDSLGVELNHSDQLAGPLLGEVLNRQYALDTPASNGVCAEVKLEIKQEAVLTRTAFDARLVMRNGSGGTLENLGVTLRVTDREGRDASDLFGIRTPIFAGFTAVDGSGVLPIGVEGDASWILIPTIEAAAVLATEYYVGGTLRYTENGREIIIDLVDVRITVMPQPELVLRYFHQRDVISDDPFTEEVEPAEPFALGVLVENQGGGLAKNLRIESAQPRIIENEKGLLIDFEIIGSSVNGLPFDRSLTAHFGDIPAGETAVAIWWMESTLQGLFVDYKATFRHLDPVGDPRLSLIHSIEIHELIRPVRVAAGDDGLPDFLVNDFPDPLDLPDTLYTSDGEKVPVGQGRNVVIDGVAGGADRLVNVTVDMPTGWGYVRLDDPSDGALQLVEVRRADGTELLAENFWQSSRTFVGGGRRPLDERTIHFLDTGSAGAYTLVFRSGDAIPPHMVAISAVVPNPVFTAVDVLDVDVSEPLSAGSLGLEDLRLLRNGDPHPLPPTVAVTALDSLRYRISGLAPATTDDAVYELVIDGTGIADLDGLSGTGVASRRWVKGEAAPALVSWTGLPSGPTTATPTSVELTFTEPLAAGSVRFGDALRLYRDGELLAGDAVQVALSGERSVRISNLDSLTALDGEYEFVVDAGQVQDWEQHAGIGQTVIAWRRDTVAPLLAELSSPPTNPRNIAVQQLDLFFNEPIDPSSLDIADFVLRRQGDSTNLLAGERRVTFEQRSPESVRVRGITWPQSLEGRYEFLVSASGIRDLAGNSGVGERTVAWTLDLTPPAAATDVEWLSRNGEPLSGTSPSVQVVLSARTAEPGLRVEVTDASQSILPVVRQLDDRRLNIPVTLAADGRPQLVLRMIDRAGNVTEQPLPPLHVDSRPLIVATTGVDANALLNVPLATPILVFHESPNLASFDASDLLLRRDGREVPVEGEVSLQAVAGEPNRFRILGLEEELSVDGRYELALRAGGVTGLRGQPVAGNAYLRWTVDQTPAEITASQLAGRGGNSSIEALILEFSEGVNLDAALHNDELPLLTLFAGLGQYADLERDDRVQLDTSHFLYEREPGERGARLIIQSQDLPDGVYEIQLDARFIQDAAGNLLAGQGDGQAGSDFILRFHQLLGDVNGDGAVNQADRQLLLDLLLGAGESAVMPLAGDVNRDGELTIDDYLLVSDRSGARVLYPNAVVPPLQNPWLIYDCNRDGHVTPFDVLVLINDLNENAARPVTASPPNGHYLNPNGDGMITPFDALFVINELNRRALAPAALMGEGEGGDQIWQSLAWGPVAAGPARTTQPVDRADRSESASAEQTPAIGSPEADCPESSGIHPLPEPAGRQPDAGFAIAGWSSAAAAFGEAEGDWWLRDLAP